LKRITIDENLSYQRALYIDVLKFFRSDVLTLAKLEDVLCSINDLYGSVRVDNGNIS